MQPGARVRTTAGMYATVVDVDGDDVILEVAPGVEVRYMKRAIMDVVSPGDEPEETVTDFTDDESDDRRRRRPRRRTPTRRNPDAEWESFDERRRRRDRQPTSSTTASTTKD